MDKAYAQKLLKEQADQLASKAPKGNKYHLAAQYFAGQVTGEGELRHGMLDVADLPFRIDYADFLTS